MKAANNNDSNQQPKGNYMTTATTAAATPTATTGQPISSQAMMTKDKDCKGSVRFSTPDPKARVSNVYVSRAMPGIEEATTIRVTVEIVN